VHLSGERFKAGAGVEVEYLNTRGLLKERLMAGKSHIDYFAAVREGRFYERSDEGGKIIDAVNLPDDVVAFSKVVEDGVETC